MPDDKGKDTPEKQPQDKLESTIEIRHSTIIGDFSISKTDEKKDTTTLDMLAKKVKKDK